MQRSFVLIPLLLVVVGIVWVLVFQTLLGALIVVGGVMGLLMTVTPAVIAWFTQGLSTGFWRRH
jgi:hypothetical protein